MYLKSLELHGFKSFPNRTILKFEPGATVVVGPNGSGKSNISDAMRWVLGEISSKNIRGTKMEDVIFGGTDDRRPMGFAEVSVTFDNTDKIHRIDSPYDEITVTRRYYRAGDSEYQINRKPVRLKDIHELFMNTGIGREGYSIIGQGKIAEILSKKSEDRRNIFEEAAGISKYRHRKEETERKLNYTEENMVRVRDILGELEVRVGPLEKEAEKARKYLDLYNEKKKADVALWVYDTERILKDIKDAEDAYKLSEHELEVVEETVSSLESQYDRLFQQSQNNKLISEQLLSKIRETTNSIHTLDNEFGIAQNEIRHCDDLITQCQGRIDNIDLSKQTSVSEKEGSQSQIANLESTISELTVAHLNTLCEAEAVKKQENDLISVLEEKLKKIRELDSKRLDLNVRINVLKNSIETGDDKKNSLGSEIAQYVLEGEKLTEDVKRCEANTANFRTKIEEAESHIADGQSKLEHLLSIRQAEVNHLGELNVSKNTLLQHAETLKRMEEHFEGYASSVRFVMKQYEQRNIKNCGEIAGPVSKLISTDPKYVTAIETALGTNIQNIVVDTEDTAKAAIACLKENHAGRATFYPMNAIKSSVEPDEIQKASSLVGYNGRADQLITYDSRFSEIMKWLLGRTVVFDNIDDASRAAKQLRYRIRIVTLDGQIINAGGSYTGGSTKRDSGILSRANEIESFSKQAAFVSKQIDKVNAKINSVTNEISELQQMVKDAEQQRDLLIAMSRSQFASLDNANAKLEANKNLLDKLKYDYDSLISDSERFVSDIFDMEQQVKALSGEIEKLSAEREDDEINKNIIGDKYNELLSKANNINIRIAETKKDVENASNIREVIEHRIKELEVERVEQIEKVSTYISKKEALNIKLKENRKAYEEFANVLSDLNDERTQVESGTSDYEKRLSELNVQIREKTNHKELCRVAHYKNDAKLKQLGTEQDRLGSKLWDEYEISYEDALNFDCPAVNADNRASVVNIQHSCRSKIRALGSVNVSSIEEYAVVKERYDALSTQVKDLKDAYEDLNSIVNKLEEEMKSSFLRTFNEINENFSVVFKELFGGGQAELTLTDPENVLTSGIEIKAAPPGKIIKNLSILSGGEQAFVAIALFFSVLKVNPTPFCILDEIEAALDEVNVFRFGDYVKKFSEQTQFVLITHRRGTMDIADRLYGVTMPERGISKVIPIDLNDVEEKKKELEADGVF